MITHAMRGMFTYYDHNASGCLREQCRLHLADLRGTVLGHPRGMHMAAHRARKCLQEAAVRLSTCVGCSPGDVVWTSGGTEADRLAVETLGTGRVLVGATEHDAVVAPLRWLESQGRCTVEVVPVDRCGRHDLEWLRDQLPGASGVFLMAANHETGVLTDLEGVAELVQRSEVWWHCDAVQAAGRMPIDLSQGPFTAVGSLALASHKVGGPAGAGALVVRREGLVPLLPGGPGVRRAGTQDVAALSAFALALELSADDVFEPTLRNQVEAGWLQRLPRGRVHGAAVPRLPNTVYVSSGDDAWLAADELVEELALRGVCVGTGAACATGTGRPSRVLTAMGVDADEAASSVRVSWDASTTDSTGLFAALDDVLAGGSTLG